MTDDGELVAKATEFVAEEMGVALRRSALSPNIRERLDHSTAVLDPDGAVAAQAEHIPVHLGSFAVGASQLLTELAKGAEELVDGKMAVVNDPYVSGTHLNDLMLLAPVFVRSRRVAYVINKAHHVDVGGPVPGSLNPGARDLYGEGVVLPPLRLVRGSRLDQEVVALLTRNVREPETSLGDLQAQVAANRLGTARVRQLVDRFGTTAVQDGWREARSRTAQLVKLGLARMKRGSARASDVLELVDRDVRLRVAVSAGTRGVTVDFAGTDPQVAAPINAVFGVTFSASSFAVRAALSTEFATNEGFYECVRVRAPPGSLVNPRRPAAVSGGNVETAQRVADVVLEALGHLVPRPLPAGSSGTMFNLMLGGVRPSGRAWAYYETIGGGSGGRANGPGVSGVHTNMTNTLNTPIEVAEATYPLRFLQYGLRRGSGGRGQGRGGDGIVRAFRLLEPMRVSLLADRFRVPPSGRRGGDPGAPGRVSVRSDSTVRWPGSKFSLDLDAGSCVVLETPGGGGFGRPPKEVGRPGTLATRAARRGGRAR